MTLDRTGQKYLHRTIRVTAPVVNTGTPEQPILGVDDDLATIAGLTATTNNVIQSVSSAWASRTPAQLMATLPAASGSAQGAMSAANFTKLAALQVPVQRLSYGANTDINNGTAVSAATYVNVGASNNFTVSSTSSFLDILVRLGGIIVAGGTNIQGSISVLIDGTTTHPIAGFGSWASELGGITGGSITLQGLSAGTHSVQVRLISSAAGTLYVRASSVPLYEFLSVFVLELNV